MNMTNEKAIDLLRRMQEPEAYEPQITEEAFEALELAIRALGTDTNVGTTDAISREAAIDALEKWLHGLFGITEADGTATIFKTIRQLPPIQFEIIHCKDCNWWTRQKDSLQGRCALTGLYPTGEWYCGNARKSEG